MPTSRRWACRCAATTTSASPCRSRAPGSRRRARRSRGARSPASSHCHERSPCMPASFLHDGDYLDHVPEAALQAGTVVVIADAIGIAVRTTPANSLGALAMSGVFDVPRAPEGVIPQGKSLYWHILDQRAVT